MEPTNELLIKIAQIRIEEAQTQLNYGAPTQALDAARVDLHLAEMALVALQDKGKPPAQPVAEVVAWSHPQSPRTCEIRALRPDIAPGLLYAAQPAQREAEPDYTLYECTGCEHLSVDHHPTSCDCGSTVWTAIPVVRK